MPRIQIQINKIILNLTIQVECENIITKVKIHKEAVYRTWKIVLNLVANTVIH